MNAIRNELWSLLEIVDTGSSFAFKFPCSQRLRPGIKTNMASISLYSGVSSERIEAFTCQRAAAKENNNKNWERQESNTFLLVLNSTDNMST